MTLWDLVSLAVTLLLVAAGGAWVQGQRTRRVLMDEPPPPRPAWESLPVDETNPHRAARRYGLDEGPAPDLRAVHHFAPGFDEAALVELLREGVGGFLGAEGAPAGGPGAGLRLSEGARTTLERRRSWGLTGLVLGQPRLVEAAADPRWVSAELVTLALLAEGGREAEWEDRWRLRSLEGDTLAWELVSVEDLFRGPPRHGPPAPGPRIAPRPEAAPAEAGVVEACRRAWGGEGLAPGFAAELALRRRRGPAVPEGGELLEVLDLGDGTVWVEGMVELLRVAERWRLRPGPAGPELWATAPDPAVGGAA